MFFWLKFCVAGYPDYFDESSMLQKNIISANCTHHVGAANRGSWNYSHGKKHNPPPQKIALSEAIEHTAITDNKRATVFLHRQKKHAAAGYNRGELQTLEH